MDPRFYIYQPRRPRHGNPTYNSQHVDSSLQFFRGGPLQRRDNNATDSKITEESQQVFNKQGKAYSHLSTYGSNVLRLDEKTIYSKQMSPYNIISMDPLSHDSSIKQYPKLHLQDKDKYYYQKMMEMNQRSNDQRTKMSQEKPKGDNIAGKLRYEVDNAKMEQSPQRKAVPFSPKMLNHMDQLGGFL